MPYTQDCSAQIERIHTALCEAEAIVIGAGAGLSAAAGFAYTGERFRRCFSDFEEKYHFHDMYEGGFYPYDTAEEYWAYWSRYVAVNRYSDPPKSVYSDLLDLVGEKNYFVITTNVDHCFQKAGFEKKRLFYTQGDYGLFQCSVPCHRTTYDNEGLIREMVAEQKDGRIPSDLIPHCPLCGRPMTMNLRSDDTFVEDSGWHIACGNYERFLDENRGKRILFWELGVGFNTPAIIKYPFWQMTRENPSATYACMNLRDASCPKEIEDRSICLSCDIFDGIRELQKKKHSAPAP